MDHGAALRAMTRAVATATRKVVPNAQRTSLMRFEHDISGNCERPFTEELYAAPGAKARRLTATQREMFHIGAGTSQQPSHATPKFIFVSSRHRTKLPLWITRHHRCRNCMACRRAHAAHWAERAAVEIAQSERTWFGSLTLSDEDLFLAESAARARYEYDLRTGEVHETSWTELGDAQRFSRLVAEGYKAVQLYLKRVRKQTGAGLRFICVAEKGRKTGRLHYHLLIHLTGGANLPSMKNHLLQPAWSAHSVWRLCYPKWWSRKRQEWVQATPMDAARYVTKYMTKEEKLMSVKASLDYGARTHLLPSESATVGAESEFVPPQASEAGLTK